LRLSVVRVVVPRAEHVRAEQDAALHFSAEAVVARRAVHRDEVAALWLEPQAEAHAVEAREVTRRFGGRDDVVGGNSVTRVGQGDGLYRHAFALQAPDRAFAALAHRRVEPFAEVLG